MYVYIFIASQLQVKQFEQHAGNSAAHFLAQAQHAFATFVPLEDVGRIRVRHSDDLLLSILFKERNNPQIKIFGRSKLIYFYFLLLGVDCRRFHFASVPDKHFCKKKQAFSGDTPSSA